MNRTLLALMVATAPAAAQTQYTDRALFLADTGATAEPAWPNPGRVGAAGFPFHLGRVTISAVAPSSGLWIGSGGHPQVGPDWTTLVDGHDIAIDGRENLDVDFDAPVTAFGFDFAEPTTITVQYDPCSPLCPCANSTFDVTLRRLGAVVASFQFSRPDDVAAFVGVESAAPFDRAEIREVSGSCDDEYFGRFWTRCAADLNADGVADFNDYLEFLNLYNADDPRVDFNADAIVDFNDYLEFLNLYNIGC